MLNSIYMFSRGLIMGVWNSHLYMGNILGSLIAGSFVNNNWGLSFIIPGIIICVGGLLIFIFLVPSKFTICMCSYKLCATFYYYCRLKNYIHLSKYLKKYAIK